VRQFLELLTSANIEPRRLFYVNIGAPVTPVPGTFTPMSLFYASLFLSQDSRPRTGQTDRQTDGRAIRVMRPRGQPHNYVCTTHFVVQQALEALVDGNRLELVCDDHAHERSHSGVHATRRSTDVYDRHPLVLCTNISTGEMTTTSYLLFSSKKRPNCNVLQNAS